MNKLPHNAGFTALEIIVAILALALGILAFTGLQMKATKNNTVSSNHTNAVSLTEAKLEWLKSLDYSAHVPGAYSDALNPINEEGRKGGIFTRIWQIDDTSLTGEFKQITVTTFRTDTSGDHNVDLSTVVSANVDSK